MVKKKMLELSCSFFSTSRGAKIWCLQGAVCTSFSIQGPAFQPRQASAVQGYHGRGSHSSIPRPRDGDGMLCNAMLLLIQMRVSKTSGDKVKREAEAATVPLQDRRGAEYCIKGGQERDSLCACQQEQFMASKKEARVVHTESWAWREDCDRLI